MPEPPAAAAPPPPPSAPEAATAPPAPAAPDPAATVQAAESVQRAVEGAPDRPEDRPPPVTGGDPLAG
jgi:hypothetical protein